METKSKVDPERLRTIAESWNKTPFADHGRLKGVGVDCVGLVAQIYIELGVLDDFSPPQYTLDGWHSGQGNPVADYIQATGKFISLPTSTPKHDLRPGDLITLRQGRVPYHTGLLVDGLKFIHAIQVRGVMYGSLADATYWVRLNGIYRLK